MRLSRILPGAHGPVLSHKHTHPTLTVLSTLTLPQPSAARPLRQHRPVLATAVRHRSPANTRRRAASHEQCHGPVFMERQYVSGGTVDYVHITAARRAGCHSQVHHLFLSRCTRLVPARCDAYSRVDRTMELDHRTGRSSQYTLNTSWQLPTSFFFGRSAASLQIYILRHWNGSVLQTIFTSVSFCASFAVDSNPYQTSTCLVGNYLGKHRLHPAV